MPRQISQQTFFVAEVFNKNVIFNVLLMIVLSVTHDFIQQIFRAAEQAPPFPAPPPPRAEQGAG
jgi:hypothetical protein